MYNRHKGISYGLKTKHLLIDLQNAFQNRSQRKFSVRKTS